MLLKSFDLANKKLFVEQDRIIFSELVKFEVKDMAYPCGGCNAHVADFIKNNTGVKYACVADVIKEFEPFEDLYQYKGSLYRRENWVLLFDLEKNFSIRDGFSHGVLYMGTCL